MKFLAGIFLGIVSVLIVATQIAPSEGVMQFPAELVRFCDGKAARIDVGGTRLQPRLRVACLDRASFAVYVAGEANGVVFSGIDFINSEFLSDD